MEVPHFNSAEPVDPQLSKLVQKCVCEIVGIPITSLFDNTRRKEVVAARRFYFYEMVNKYKCSPSALERFHYGVNGVDHSNILHHVAACEDFMLLYPPINQKVVVIEELIKRELEILDLKRKRKGKSWTITRKHHRHQSFITMRLASHM